MTKKLVLLSIGTFKLSLVRLAHAHCEKVQTFNIFWFCYPFAVWLVLLSQRNFFKDQYLKGEPEVSQSALNL